MRHFSILILFLSACTTTRPTSDPPKVSSPTRTDERSNNQAVATKTTFGTSSSNSDPMLGDGNLAGGKDKGAPPPPPPPPRDHSACYVDVYESDNFEGWRERIQGPASLGKMHVNGHDRGDAIDSLKTGPGVKLLAVFEDENFSDDKLEFGPNRQVAKLREFNFDDEIDSLTLVCE